MKACGCYCYSSFVWEPWKLNTNGLFFLPLERFERISLERLDSIELEKARGDRVNTFMLVAPRVKLFESVWANLAAELFLFKPNPELDTLLLLRPLGIASFKGLDTGMFGWRGMEGATARSVFVLFEIFSILSLISSRFESAPILTTFWSRIFETRFVELTALSF